MKRETLLFQKRKEYDDNNATLISFFLKEMDETKAEQTVYENKCRIGYGKLIEEQMEKSRQENAEKIRKIVEKKQAHNRYLENYIREATNDRSNRDIYSEIYIKSTIFGGKKKIRKSYV
jgi:hypothetical protein